MEIVYNFKSNLKVVLRESAVNKKRFVSHKVLSFIRIELKSDYELM